MIWANVTKFGQNFIAPPKFFGLVRLCMYVKDCHHHKTSISDRTNFFLPYYSSSRLQRCIKYSGVRLWNCIPENIKKLAKILLRLIKKS